MTALPAVLRGAYGLALCAAPGLLIGLAGDPPPGRRARTVARVLGARQVAQAALSGAVLASGTVRGDQAELLTLSAAVDGAHAVSMLGLAALDPRCRRAGIADGLIALAFAGQALARARQ